MKKNLLILLLPVWWISFLMVIDLIGTGSDWRTDWQFLDDPVFIKKF
jgi:hypothetical protein